jgi:hypothetical protein
VEGESSEGAKALRDRTRRRPTPNRQEDDIGQVYAVRAGGVVIRRILMPKTRMHVFYEVWSDEKVVMIVALWGATKEQGPDIDR